MITVQPLTDRPALNTLIAQQPLNPFLQSWTWGDFQSAIGRHIWRLGAYENGQLVGAALVVEHQLMLGRSYLYCPRGPMAASVAAFQAMVIAIADLGRQQGAMYAKIDPGRYDFELPDDAFTSEFVMGTTLQPRTTLLLDLRPTAEQLLAAMHQKTRYNIRLAEKKGVTVRWSVSDADIDFFLSLMHATAERQNIRLHSDRYYHTMIQTLHQTAKGELAIASLEGVPLAANLVIWHGQTATYLHGGSSDAQKEVMSPYLLQWRTIERAKEMGCTTYDFWGIAPPGAVGHRWAGITRFKEGFGGDLFEFPPAANAVLKQQWYLAYRFAKRMRGGVDE